jgi:hypothetical protein
MTTAKITPTIRRIAFPGSCIVGEAFMASRWRGGEVVLFLTQ